MDKVLREYFGETCATDIHPYGYGGVADFLRTPHEVGSYDWVVTNPPFNLAEEFVARALQIARRGVAILARTVFIESVGRYERVFRSCPPAFFAQFVERVPMVKGRLDPKASTATGYAWFVWLSENRSTTEVVWIPPCRKKLERKSDYEMPESRLALRQAQADLFGFNVSSRCNEAKR
jgi:hypothetical protein